MPVSTWILLCLQCDTSWHSFTVQAEVNESWHLFYVSFIRNTLTWFDAGPVDLLTSQNILFLRMDVNNMRVLILVVKIDVDRDSAVGISTMLRSGRSGDRIPVGVKFSAPVQTGPGARSANLLYNGYRVSSRG